MQIIETYWYVWALLTIACIVIAFTRQFSKIRNFDKVSSFDDAFSGMGLTFILAGTGWIFGIVTVLSIILNVISYVK